MGKGVAGFFSLLFADFLVFVALISTFTSVALFIGLIQLIYVIPGCMYLWKKHKTFAQGVIIAAAIVFLLDSLCYGIINNI